MVVKQFLANFSSTVQSDPTDVPPMGSSTLKKTRCSRGKIDAPGTGEGTFSYLTTYLFCAV